MELIYFIDLAGTFVFAISGGRTAIRHKMDLFGALILGTVTAIGGGTLRDLLIGSTPVGWMLDINYFIVILAGVASSIAFRKTIRKLSNTIFLFDTLGIALFTILGVQKTLLFGLSPAIAVIMGAVSAVFGGVLRDVLSNEVPLIFRKDFYATVCLIGGMIYLALLEITGAEQLSMIFGILVVVAVRVLAVRRKWRLPIPGVKQY